MKCLADNCEKEIDNKTGRRKFCSNACKMKYFRKHGKKNTASKFDMQVLLNEFKATLEELKTNGIQERKVTPLPEKTLVAQYNATHTDQYTEIENKSIFSLFDDFVIEIQDCRSKREAEALNKRIWASLLEVGMKNKLEKKLQEKSKDFYTD